MMMKRHFERMNTYDQPMDANSAALYRDTTN
ncbi:MAG: hypothetical protein RI960_1689 [Pseudomonadota bacterium]|jgi:hypothetical protein